MKNKILLSIVIILLPIAVISFLHKETNFNLSKKEEKELPLVKNYTLKVLNPDETITEMDLEEYVIGVVAGEMPASFEKEALKAQAVASRTYAMYKKSLNNEYDVMTTTADQVYLNQNQMQEKWQDEYSKYYNKIKEAVEETKNMVVKHDNQVIKSYYFAMSNGYTEDAINVFKEKQDYLVSVESEGENEISANVIKTIMISKTEFCNKLGINCFNIEIKDINYSASGRINSLIINNQSFSGVEVRNLLNLRSTDFVINIKDNDTLEITTNGYGHGVGMSQYGADAMAKSGASYDQILTHYYKDTEVTEI